LASWLSRNAGRHIISLSSGYRHKSSLAILLFFCFSPPRHFVRSHFIPLPSRDGSYTLQIDIWSLHARQCIYRADSHTMGRIIMATGTLAAHHHRHRRHYPFSIGCCEWRCEQSSCASQAAQLALYFSLGKASLVDQRTRLVSRVQVVFATYDVTMSLRRALTLHQSASFTVNRLLYPRSLS
jgi:hypothetical protein